MEVQDLDEPFRKRPRLSLFPSDEPLDADLGGRRMRNDLLLKSRFESIFDKYAHDFSGTGDEIEMASMTVVVDNGHLHFMTNETDPGSVHHSKGHTLLRAITEVRELGQEESHDAETDEVMNTIDEMAENAAMAEEQEEVPPMDSDEELFLPVHPRTTYVTPPRSKQSDNTSHSTKSRSAHASLLDTPQRRRSASPASSSEAQFPRPGRSGATNSVVDVAGSCHGTAESDILRKFGPQVGQEVLSIIQKTRSEAAQAHIEPAWRVPSDMLSPRPRRLLSKSDTPSEAALESTELQQSLSPVQTRSLWKPKRFRPTKKAMQAARARERFRAESEDPLQEAFADEDNSSPVAQAKPEPSVGQDVPTAYKTLPDDDSRIWKEETKIIDMRKGLCVFCGKQWTNKTFAFRHWVRLGKKFAKSEVPEDEVHDIEYIQAFLASSSGKPIGPRLYATDFRILVVLHEGDGLSFEEIMGTGYLRNKKPIRSLINAYDGYRNADQDLDEDAEEWSQLELDTLHQLCRNKELNMRELIFSFKKRSNVDIGNKLAEIWLDELEVEDHSSVESTPRPQYSIEVEIPARSSINQIAFSDLDRSDGEMSLKKEPNSDDELFGPG